MGDINDEIFIRKYAADFKGPYLEVGSKDMAIHRYQAPFFEH